MIEESIINVIIIIGAIGGIGGLAGGMISGRRATVVGSILVGVIGGISVAMIVSAFDQVPPVAEVGDYSALWSLVAGAILAYIVGSSSG